MAGISAKDVKALRDSTGAGMMDCKKALSEAEGDVEKAMEILRASGLAKAGKRAGRETSEGAVVFSAQGGKGALIELGCETDFVAKTDDFQGLAQNVADAVAAAGGINVMRNIETSWGRVGWEAVGEQDPEFILLLDYGDGGQGLIDFLQAHPVMSQTTAVLNHRYLALEYGEITPGPANIDAIEKIAKALYPHAF